MKITGAQLQQIYAHAAETYPAECCGFLLGQGGQVCQTRRAINQSQTPTNRFLIAPQEFAQTLYAAAEAGLDIIGVYHSHPDNPSRPSPIDLENAWPEVIFLIISVQAGLPLQAQAWQLTETGNFEEAPLEIVDNYF